MIKPFRWVYRSAIVYSTGYRFHIHTVLYSAVQLLTYTDQNVLCKKDPKIFLDAVPKFIHLTPHTSHLNLNPGSVFVISSFIYQDVVLDLYTFSVSKRRRSYNHCQYTGWVKSHYIITLEPRMQSEGCAT